MRVAHSCGNIKLEVLVDFDFFFSNLNSLVSSDLNIVLSKNVI
jgi:hypothetical protein